LMEAKILKNVSENFTFSVIDRFWIFLSH
jgi:hypothetical protein